MANDVRDEEVEVRIKYEDPSDSPIFHATNMAVQSTGHEFILNFYEIMPPLIIGTEEEKKTGLKALGNRVSAKPLVRVVVVGTRIEEFIRLLQENAATRSKKSPQIEVEAKK